MPNKDFRMSDFNKVELMGRLTRDPELRDVGSSKLCKLGMVVSKKFKLKNGEMKEETLFINVVLWGNSAEYVAKMSKGDAVLVEGGLRMNEWDDTKTGQKRSTIEVNAHRVQAMTWAEQSAASQPQSQGGVDEPDTDADSIPF